MKEFAIFIIISIFLIFGSMTIYNTGGEISWQETVNASAANETYTVDTDWAQESTYNNCTISNTDDLIYPDPNSYCEWQGDIQEEEAQDILFLTTDADARDGEVNFTVSAYEYPPGNQNGPNETVTYTVPTGTETYEVGFKNFNYFDVRIDMVENDGSANQRPHVDSFNLTYAATEENLVGVESDTVRFMAIMIFLLSLFLFFSKVAG